MAKAGVPMYAVAVRLARPALLNALFFACGACGSRTATRDPSVDEVRDASARGTIPTTDAAPTDKVVVPTLDELAARGAFDVPLMREVLRVDDATHPFVVVEAAPTDTCVRGALATEVSVRARFEDATGGARGGEFVGHSGLVPPRGPVCIRKGETLRFVITEWPNETATARAVFWQAP